MYTTGQLNRNMYTKKKLEERVDELIEEKKRIWNKINKYSIVVPKKKKKKKN